MLLREVKMKRFFYLIIPIIFGVGIVVAQSFHPGTRIKGDYSGGWGKDLLVDGRYSGAIGNRARVRGASTVASLCVGRGSVSASYSVLFGDADADALSTANTFKVGLNNGLALQNDATISNATNNQLSFTENNENLIWGFSANAVVCSTTTGVTEVRYVMALLTGSDFTVEGKSYLGDAAVDTVKVAGVGTFAENVRMAKLLTVEQISMGLTIDSVTQVLTDTIGIWIGGNCYICPKK